MFRFDLGDGLFDMGEKEKRREMEKQGRSVTLFLWNCVCMFACLFLVY